MDLIGDDLHPRIKGGWKTDFSNHSVPFNEIFSGGVPRDGIPPIDNPEFASLIREPSYMRDDEPVIALEIDGKAKAYPLLIMTRHEIVNDELAGIPVTVTYCPLCNSAIVFDRRVGSRVLDFGVSGNLRNSDLIMWDRQTESWWQQLEGEAIVGDYTGTQLEFIPAPVVSWKTYKESFPEGLVLLRNPRLLSSYDRPPYRGYDEFGTDPFLFDPSKIDPRLDPVERVIAIKFGREAVAYPFEKLKEYPVVNDTVNGQDIVAFYAGDGTISPFPTPNGSVDRVVGATAVFDPNLDGQKLTFKSVDGIITDEQTNSKWDILGNAVEGPLTGNKLDAVVHANHFWFAWAAFNPETSIWSPDDAMMSKAQ